MSLRRIRKQLLLVAIAPAVLVAVGLALYFLALRYHDADAALAARGAAQARQLAGAAERSMAEGNRAELLRLARTAAAADVLDVVITDTGGQVLAREGKTDLRAETDAPGAARADRRPFRAAVPAAGSGAPLGDVRIDLSLADNTARKHEALAVTVLAIAVLLGAAAALAYRLARTIADPASELEAAIGRIRDGQSGARVAVHPGGALEAIETRVNDLAAALEATRRSAADNLARREAELARQLGFAQAMLDAQANSGIGLAVIEHGRIVFANHAVERMSGYTLQELRDLPHFVQIAHPDDRELITRNHLQHLAGAGFEARYDFTLLRKDGGRRHIQLAQTSIATGRQMQVLGILLDITERKAAETQLAETHRQLLARKEEAERANLAKSRFLAAASHDLRQPLHALMLFGAELETAAITPGQKRLAGQIAAASGAMGELLDALLEVSRLDTTRLTPQRQAFALGPLLEGVADAQRQSAAAKGLRLSCVPTRAWVDSDPHLLRRLVGNLVANAVRYTHHGGIVVGARRAGEELRIEIWDTGIGIDPEHLPHIFQEFYQVGNSERDTGKGLGLGLAIVQRIAQMLGHPLHVRSTLRRGTVFGVSLPRAAPVALPVAARTASVPHTARILVAGESQPELESLGNLIENWGYRVLRAGDQRLLRAHMAAMPDLVVCDERFVKGLAQTLVGRPRPRPQVVLVGEASGEALPFDIFFDGRLAKPFKPGRLRALLHHLLEEETEAAGTVA